MHQHLLFVYGTLKRGEPNHHWMLDDKGKASFIGIGETVNKYPLVIASRYNIPFLLDVPGRGKSIRGEVYSIDDAKLKHLDILEEYPRLYTRRKEKISMPNNETAEAITYFLIRHEEEMLQMEFISDYSSAGDHGKEYSSNDDLKHPEDICIEKPPQ